MSVPVPEPISGPNQPKLKTFQNQERPPTRPCSIDKWKSDCEKKEVHVQNKIADAEQFLTTMGWDDLLISVPKRSMHTYCFVINSFLNATVYSEFKRNYIYGRDYFQHGGPKAIHLFHGIMAKNRVNVSYCVPILDNFIDLQRRKTNKLTTANVITLWLTVLDVLKNVFESTKREYDPRIGTALGWFNLWLLGCEVIIKNEVDSIDHCRMLRNAIAHHQFYFSGSKIHFWNKPNKPSGDEPKKPSGDELINWWITIESDDLTVAVHLLRDLIACGFIYDSQWSDNQTSIGTTID